MVDTDIVKTFIKLDGEKDDVEEAGSKEVSKKKAGNVVSGSRTAVIDQDRGVIYLSHIPFGFFEKEMFKFFSQFGSVTNVRLGRSKKTGASRGYAFIEFRYADVAKIVAETMNNYLMFEKLLKCKVVPPEQVKASMFKGKVDARRPPGLQARILSKKKINATRTVEQEKRRSKAFRLRAVKVNKKLSELGIEIPMLELLQAREKIAKQVSPPKKSEKKKQKLEQKVVEKETNTPAGKKHKLETSDDGNKSIADKNLTGEKNGNKKQKIETKSEAVVPEKKQKVPKVQVPVPEKKNIAPAEALATPSDAKKKKIETAKELMKPKVNSPASTPKVISTPLQVQKVKKPEMTTPAAAPKQPELTKTPKQLDQNKTPKQSAKTPIEEPNKNKTPKQQSKPTPKSDVKKNKTPKSSKSPGNSKNVHLDLSILLGGGSAKINTPKQKEVKKTPKSTPVATAKPKTPTVMEVDSEDDEEITLKTPPNVKKIKSRSNSRTASAVNTPTAMSLQKGMFEKLTKKGSTPSLDSAAQKLSNLKAKTPSTPKIRKK